MSMLELRQILKCKDSIRMDFENVVGKDGSLHYAIQQIKSAIACPGGLPILLVGENGTGKKISRGNYLSLLYKSRNNTIKCTI